MMPRSSQFGLLFITKYCAVFERDSQYCISIASFDFLCIYAKFLPLRQSIKQTMCIMLQQHVQVAAALEFQENARPRLPEFGVAEMLAILDR
jgi:hypothetical protein